MSRAVRTARGALGAFIATLLAATSHALAGGPLTPTAVFATSLFALPLCVLLAGKTGSLWRLAIGVSASQFVYHWSFAGLGAPLAGDSTDATMAVSPHSSHMTLFTNFPLATAESGASVSDAWMWVAHACAAIVTIFLMHRGEIAFLHLVRVLKSAIRPPLPRSVRLPEYPTSRSITSVVPPQVSQLFFSDISHRGPPTSLVLL